MKRDGLKGTITVFMSLLAVLFLSLACTLVESARVQGTRAKAGVVTDLGLFSLFGEYERQLLEEYDVFFLDGAYGTESFSADQMSERLKGYLEGNLTLGVSPYLAGFQMFPLKLTSCQVTDYALMTDNSGAVFYEQVVKNVKETLGTEVVSRFLEAQQQAEELEQSADSYESSQRGNDAELAVLTKEAQEAAQTEPMEGTEESAENPLDIIKKVKRMGILALVVKDESVISTKAVHKGSLPSGRSLNRGSLKTEQTETGITAEAIFQDYLMEHFSCMTDETSEQSLDYQIEYILGGKATDRENLKYVVNRLLLLREGANFACALADTTMRRQAEAVALSVSGITGIAALTPAVTTAVLLAWAYGESLMDVRLLLAGGKVELVKTAANWKLSAQNLGQILETLQSCDSGGGSGLDYEAYLRILLAAGSKGKYPMRALDMLEANVRLLEGAENFRVDHGVAKLKAEAQWELPMVFFRVPAAFLGKKASAQSLQVSGVFGY